jgi:hypothetical protein
MAKGAQFRADDVGALRVGLNLTDFWSLPSGPLAGLTCIRARLRVELRASVPLPLAIAAR